MTGNPQLYYRTADASAKILYPGPKPAAAFSKVNIFSFALN